MLTIANADQVAAWDGQEGEHWAEHAERYENATRRTVHPLWQTLQECANRFGPLTEPLKRLRPQPSLDASRSVHQAASSLVGFAARKGLTTLEAALPEFFEELRREFQSRGFEDDRQSVPAVAAIRRNG